MGTMSQYKENMAKGLQLQQEKLFFSSYFFSNFEDFLYTISLHAYIWYLLRFNYVPDIVLKALYVLTNLMLTRAPWGSRYFYGPHFRDMNTAAQRG